MATSKLKDFFNGRFFEIPKYQRGYAWELNNVRDLFDDIFESIESKTNHYLGTIVLSSSRIDEEQFYIVDGQQRIVTLSMIFQTIINNLKKKDSDYYYRFYIYEDEYRLKLLGKDKEYFIELIKGNEPLAQNKSQRLMQKAYEEIKSVVDKEKQPLKLLKSVEKLEIMEFIEDSEGDAIRIFQTVNDRGKPLSNMEKAKSLLVYFSNRYLNKKLDNKINEYFGEIFELYDDIKHIGEEIGINLIKNIDFNEDNVMRYHFITYSDENYDATAMYVLRFLKNNLRSIRSNEKENSYSEMEEFILKYIESLHSFFESLKAIVERAKENVFYYKVFVILGVSATLYPLIVKLEMLDILDEYLPDEEYEDHTFLQLIEIIDVRVYKTRGTDPRAQITKFAYDITEDTSKEEIQNWLLWFNQRWMSRQEFSSNLNGYIFRNPALYHIFIDYCEHLKNETFSLVKLKNIIDNKKPTIEHVLSQTPKFSFRSHGFKDEDDFLEFENIIGNLTLLEKRLNSSVQNRNAIEKVSYYDKSIFKMTKELASSISKKGEFKKAHIKERTKEIATYCNNRWWDE